ncbi:MAG: tetratricopeptide repeat protein, partial [Mariprofundaceae bacterium]
SGKLFWKVAVKGNAGAQNMLGSMYQLGRGVAFDPKQALVWYQRAAKSGYVRAQLNLGNLYRTGEAGKQHDEKAVLWYRKAAEKGFAPAQNALGYMYAEGRGIKEDYLQAKKWFKAAAVQGLNIANENRQKLEHYRKATISKTNQSKSMKINKDFKLMNIQVENEIKAAVLTDENLDLAYWLEKEVLPNL